MTLPTQASQAVQQGVGAGITVDAQVHDAWSAVQNFFGAWGRATYGSYANLATYAKGLRT